MLFAKDIRVIDKTNGASTLRWKNSEKQ